MTRTKTSDRDIYNAAEKILLEYEQDCIGDLKDDFRLLANGEPVSMTEIAIDIEALEDSRKILKYLFLCYGQ